MRLTEKLKQRHRVYAGKIIRVSADEVVTPGGTSAVREYIEHPGAVAVLAFADRDRIILVRQYRYPVGQVTYEIPAGKLDKGEKPLDCVRRELAEETGYAARRVKKFLSFWPTPAFSNEVIHIYRAEDLRPSAASPDEDEFIETVTVSAEQALRWVKTGKIRDSKTVIALLHWKATGK